MMRTVVKNGQKGVTNTYIYLDFLDLAVFGRGLLLAGALLHAYKSPAN
jgi:hypothetical protein